MGFLGKVASFFRGATEFLIKHSRTIAIILIPPALVLGAAGAALSLAFIGWIAVGIGAGVAVFLFIDSKYRDYKESEDNKAKEEEIANQLLEEARNEINDFKLDGTNDYEKMENAKSMSKDNESLLKLAQIQAEHKKELEQIRSELNTVKVMVVNVKEKQQIDSHQACLKELHKEREKSKVVFGSDSDSGSDNSDSEGKSFLPEKKRKPSSPQGKNIVSSGSMFATSPKDSIKTQQKPANDPNVMGVTPMQK